MAQRVTAPSDACNRAFPTSRIKNPDERPFDSERKANYVLFSFYSTGESRMFRTIAEEAAALASLALFLGMIAIWAQVIATL